MEHPTRSSLAQWLAILLLAVLITSSVHPGGGIPLRANAGPQVVVLQPDAANGTDTSVLSANPTWNFGNNASLWVGRDPSSGGLDRSLLSFNLASIPSNATIVNATLSLYETAGSGGTVQAGRAMVPWTEGDGGRGWTRVPVTVSETAGVPRTLEPVGVTITFPAGSVVDPARDLLVWDGSTEVPSQVYRYTYSGGQVTSALVYFDVSLGAFGTKTFNITYSANGTAVPAYRQRTWSSTALWTAGPAGVSVTGASVADLDGDGKLEAVFGGADGFLYVANGTGDVIRSIQVSTSGSAIVFPPQVVDLRHNGTLDIVVVTNDPSIVSLDRNGNVVWTNTAVPLVYTIPTFVDVNNDGVLDVIIGGNMARIEALSGLDGITVLQNYPVPQAGYTATVADINGDGTPEILFGGDDGNVHAYTLGGTELWANAPTKAQFLEMALAYGDLWGNGIPAVVSGDFSTNGLEFALYASNGTNAWSYTTSDYTAGGQTLADVNGDGRLEDYFGNTAGTFYALAADGSLLWSQSAGTVQGGTPTIADLDKSGTPDILFIEGPTVTVYDGGGAVLHTWTIAPTNLPLRPGQQEMASPMVADLTGDGTLEVLVPTGSGLQAFETGALDHDWRVFGYNLNHTSRAFDGNSPNGTAFLQASVGAAQLFPAGGASWMFRNGVAAWANAGGDFSVAEANATGAVGWMSWNVTRMFQDWHAGTFPNVGLVLTEADEASGVLHTFASSDAANPAQRPILSITYVLPSVDPVPRIVGKIPDQVRAENSPPWSINLQGYAADDDTSLTELRWNVTGFNPSIIQITGLNTPGNQVLTISPQTNAYGNNRVTYWLTDLNDHTATQQAWINITPVNQPPTFNPPPTLFIHYNRSYRFDYRPYIADVDTPQSLLTLSTDDASHTTVSGLNVSYLYPYSYLNQWVFVTLTVRDGQYAVARVVAVKVTADDPPVLDRPLPDVTMLEGATLPNYFNLNDYFADPNNDALFYSTGYAHIDVTILTNHSVDFHAPLGWWGQENVTFRAKDPTGAIAEDTILVTVLHVDRPPAIGPVPDLRVHYDSLYTFNLEPYLTDPDTPLALLVVTVSDSHVNVSEHLLKILYPASYNNTVQNVTIFVSDGYFTVNRTIRVTVGSDWPPNLRVKMLDASFAEDTTEPGAYYLPSYFDDPDGSQLFWSSGNTNVLVTIDGNGTVDLAASPNWYGAERVTFRATDGQGGLTEDSVWITVTPVDDAPFFRPVPVQRLNVTTAYLSLTEYLGDPDTNITQLFLLSASGMHARIVGQGLLLNYSSDLTETIQVVVTDGTLTNATTIDIEVALPSPTSTETIPGFIYWIPPPIVAAVLAAFLLYRRRQLEWAFLVTKDGLLVSSISRQSESTIDTDLLTGMLTTIMDFANKSFSEEGEDRNLEGLELGEKRVAIVKGELSYLAVVYRGRTPGSLTRIMRTLLTKIEAEYRDALGTIVDSSKLGDIPVLLQRLVTRGNLPFVSFGEARKPAGARSNGL